MLKLQLAISIASIVLYLFIVGSKWIDQAKQRQHDSSNRHSYFWGLFFSGAFYFGLPIWLFRYGLRTTAKLMLGCVGVFAIVQVGLYTAGAEDLGLVIMLIIRAGGGAWVAKHDPEWRSAALVLRQARVTGES